MTNFGLEKRRNSLRYFTPPTLWEIAVVALIFYAFFVQYAIRPLSYAMALLSAVCIMFSVLYLIACGIQRYQSFYYIILLFVFVSLGFGLILGVSASMSLYVGLRMLEYSMTGLSVYMFSIMHRERFTHILFFTWLSIFLLAASVLLKGTMVSYGAIGLAELNSNELSSFLLLAVFCAFLLYGETGSVLQRGCIWLSLALFLTLQVETASRRGFVVMVFMLVLQFVFVLLPYNDAKRSRKRMIFYLFLVMVGAIALVALYDYIMTETVLGERLSGNMIGGDQARMQYQTFAMEQFRKDPAFGIGIGGVAFLNGVYSHSLYLEGLACTGLIGSVPLFLALAAPIRRLIKKLLPSRRDRLSGEETYFYKTTLLYLSAIVISGVAVVMIYDFYFYLSLGLIAAEIKITENKRREMLQMPWEEAQSA